MDGDKREDVSHWCRKKNDDKKREVKKKKKKTLSESWWRWNDRAAGPSETASVTASLSRLVRSPPRHIPTASLGGKVTLELFPKNDFHSHFTAEVQCREERGRTIYSGCDFGGGGDSLAGEGAVKGGVVGVGGHRLVSICQCVRRDEAGSRLPARPGEVLL